jgi:hypothetical protein
MQLEVIRKNLTFSQALKALKQFQMIKCPEWEGFWFLEGGKIKVMQYDGIVTNKPWIEQNVLREDWQVVDVIDDDEDGLDLDCPGCAVCGTDYLHDLHVPTMKVVHVATPDEQLEEIFKKFGIVASKVWMN